MVNKKKKHRRIKLDAHYGAATIVDVREAILKRLKETKRSRYWLAQQVGKHLTMPAVYQYLARRSDMTGEHIERLLSALELEIRPRE